MEERYKTKPMNLITESYVSQLAQWPVSGKHILAQFWEQASEQTRQLATFQASMEKLDRCEQALFPTPERIAKGQRSLELWREVTAPLLSVDR